MTQPTNYQFVKLGSNLEYLCSVCAASVQPTSDLASYPNLIKNIPAARYSPAHVVGALKTLLILLQDLGLEQSLRLAEAFRPIIQEMETFLQQPNAEHSYLHHPFAERLATISKQVYSAVRSEMNKGIGETTA
jgi:hypothetical protein